MGDATTKIFLNTKGTKDDVPPDVKAFLDYINGIMSDDDFVREIDEEIQKAKLLEHEEVSYMTLEMKLEEMHEDGIQQGLQQGEDMTMARNLNAVMQKLHLTANEAMDMFDIPVTDRPRYAGLL